MDLNHLKKNNLNENIGSEEISTSDNTMDSPLFNSVYIDENPILNCDNKNADRESKLKAKILGRVHSIETFGAVDGPGLRYILFLQGCPMRCLYCHNPDTWRTTGGKLMSVEEVLDDYEKYRVYLKNGGITVTGGEPLLQMDFVTELFKEAKKRNIHTALDSSGALFSRETNLEKYKELIKYVDLVLLDIKHIDDEGHRKLTGFSNRNILDFLKFLDENGVEVWIRHVIVPGITYDAKLLERLGYELGRYKNIKKVDVLPYHNMGEKKYEELGIKYPLKGTKPMTDKHAKSARDVILYGMRKYRMESR
ncbi:pyruvate formate-lyase-activating protein [uncultured Peptoniphilus sp.]|uniref:pyruvate formate-lyase-activating protein n=1 Tax=uncultured Peptoniphilus sp. TaxID=254354 RepID=UPI002805AE2F|nr:pyruvate formate-lyase-activating protein [uncultured Peptoniphilus sp.]